MSSPRFSIVPAWIITDSRLKGKDLQVLCLLGTYTNKEGWCRRSQVKMAEQLGCGRSTVQDSLNRLADIGAIEKLRVESNDGRDSAHWYRVILDRAVSRELISAWAGEPEEDNDPILAEIAASTPAGEPAPPAGIPAPPAGPRPAPPAGPGPAPINDSYLTTQSNKTERGRERAGSGSDGNGSPAVATAELVKRVQKFCTGEGYREGEWPRWTTSTVGHIAKRFALLSAEERDLACAGRDAFLAKCKRERVKKPMPVANYFRDKIWEMLTEADRAAVRPVAGGAPVVSNGKCPVPVYGPAYSAARAWALLSGPVHFELPDNLRDLVKVTYDTHARRSAEAAHNFLAKIGLTESNGTILFPSNFEAQERERRMPTEGYPEVMRLHTAARERGHVTVAAIFEGLKHLCEPVKVGSDLWHLWIEEHQRRGWQFIPPPASLPVVYFPKGGPAGLDEFERAVRSTMEARDVDDAA